MGFPTRPSNVRVYQFHHPGNVVIVSASRYLPPAGGAPVVGVGAGAGVVPAGAAPPAVAVPAGGVAPAPGWFAWFPGIGEVGAAGVLAALRASSWTTLRVGPRWPVVISASASDVTKNSPPSTIVARVTMSVAPRPPNTVCAEPPNAPPARPPPLPD